MTFDDGPHPGYTDKLLDIFEKNNIKVTFFVVGKMVRKYPFLLNKIYKNRHEIGNHTFNHPILTGLTDEEILKELELGRIEIKKVCNIDVNLLRPPSGRFNERVINIAANRGFKVILWAINSGDYGCNSSKSIKDKVLNSLQDGDIVLMHSGIDATISALPEIIASLKADGFKFKTVSELIKDNKLNLAVVKSCHENIISRR